MFFKTTSPRLKFPAGPAGILSPDFWIPTMVIVRKHFDPV